MRRHRTVMFLVSVWLTASTAYAMAGEVGLFYSSGQPQTEFAANEIRSALKTRGDAVVAGDLLQLLKAMQQIRIAIAASGEESHQIASVFHCADLKSGVSPQSYAIRKSISERHHGLC